MIQNVRTRWNSIFEMLKRTHLLRDTIEEWLTHTIVLKLQCLKLTTNEWKQIETIIDILRSFQQITNFLNSSTQSTIHIAWIVYNTMHAHLKNCSQKLREERSKFLQNLRSIINATQEKLKKYYDATSSKKDLYFNLDLCLNSCDKLNYYKICYYNSLFSLHRSWI
jgi:Asp-tRNA(Asn)/Glu-tRNA(Gln) amidotransferase C subunit